MKQFRCFITSGLDEQRAGLLDCVLFFSSHAMRNGWLATRQNECTDL